MDQRPAATFLSCCRKVVDSDMNERFHASSHRRPREVFLKHLVVGSYAPATARSCLCHDAQSELELFARSGIHTAPSKVLPNVSQVSDLGVENQRLRLEHGKLFLGKANQSPQTMRRVL